MNTQSSQTFTQFNYSPEETQRRKGWTCTFGHEWVTNVGEEPTGCPVCYMNMHQNGGQMHPQPKKNQGLAIFLIVMGVLVFFLGPFVGRVLLVGLVKGF